MSLTYSSYLELDELLSLQQPRSEGPEHDELLFIIIHQTYELWFMEMLHEVDRLLELLNGDALFRASHTARRIRTILKVLVSQMDILETMTPLEFQSFRDRLESASGFQSGQFRELEFVMGYKRPQVLKTFPEGSRERNRLNARLEAPTLWDALLHLLARQGYAVPATQLDRDVTRPVTPDAEVQKLLIEVYQGDPAVSNFCELMVDLDEGVQEWRYRHVKMVERTIGDLSGTGGSSGTGYLKKTLFSPFFPDLWTIRSRFGADPGRGT